MAPEKHIQPRTEDMFKQPCSGSHAHRRKLMVALGVAAVIAVGITIGLGMSMFCDQILKGSLQTFSHPTALGGASGSTSQLHARQLLDPITSTVLDTSDTSATTAASVVAGVTATRPIKYFGPTIAPELAAAWKLEHGVNSVEKRDAEEEFESIVPRAAIVHRVWQPAPGLNWTYQLDQPPTSDQLKNPSQYNVWDIDLFDTPQSSIQTIQAAGSRVICYFSGGTNENWRPDTNNFTSADNGKAMGDWPGENWINTNSTNVRKIMAARLDLAQQKGCDGVDPDNMDAYNHDTGFNLTQNDAINYVTYLAQQAAQRGLATSLKNAGDIISNVVKLVQYSVEEACSAYDECNLYTPFINAKKPVFHVEYPKGYGVVNTATVASSSMAAICTCKPNWKFSPIVKNNNLDTWQQECS